MSAEAEAAAIDYMSGVSSALITASTSRKERERAQEYAKQESELAYQRAIEQRDYANEYNSPLAKRRRLEEAGISAWTEYGDMGNTTEAIKPPVTPTMPAAEPLRLPAMNLFGNLMAVNQQKLQTKSLEASLVSQGIDNENKMLQNEMTKFFISREMERDANFKAAQQAEALKAWQRLADEHSNKLTEFARAQETYEYLKTQRKYDEQGKQLLIQERQQELMKMNKELSMMDLQGELLRQQFNLGTQSILNLKQQYDKITNEEQYNQFIRDRNGYYMNKYDIDPSNTGTIETLTKKLLLMGEKMGKNMQGAFGKPTYDERPLYNPVNQ